MAKMNNDIEYTFKLELANTDIEVCFKTHDKKEYENIKMLAHFIADGYTEIMRTEIHNVVNNQFKELDMYFLD